MQPMHVKDITVPENIQIAIFIHWEWVSIVMRGLITFDNVVFPADSIIDMYVDM